MKLPENPTKKVRDIIATVLQCPGYEINEKGLYEIKKLCDHLDTAILTMRLHAGDCCSLNNEVELFRCHWEDAEERCKELEVEIKVQKQRVILSESQNYCKICGNILGGYVPPREKMKIRKWLKKIFYAAIYKCPKCGHKLQERDVARICMNCGWDAYEN